MLFYLDNYLSSVARIDPRTGRLLQGLNENYGRELLELHTVGVDAGYTQEDVFDAARCFTGWGIDQRTGGIRLPRRRTTTRAPRACSASSVPAGGQAEDGDRLLDYLADHPATARFVSWQARRSVSWRTTRRRAWSSARRRRSPRPAATSRR